MIVNDFLDGLDKMFIQLKVVPLDENPKAVLVFAVGCAIIGVTAVILDLSFYFLRNRSLLDLKHGWNTFIFLIAWAVGSFIMGYVGQLVRIFQVHLMSCVLVGFTWPVLFTKLLEKLSQEQEEEVEPIPREED